jgi:hypothetical protein
VLKFINSFLPVTGDIQSALEAYKAYKDKDYVGTGLGALGMLPLIPNITKYTKGSEKAIKELSENGSSKAPTIIVPKRGKIQDVMNSVRDRKGNYAAQRVERAADEVPNLEQQFTENALHRAFIGDGDNATGMMVMNPRAFENYAQPIPPDYLEPTYINELSNIARDSGFSDVPFLELGRNDRGELVFLGHEGRHRTRALTDLGDESSIVRMIPRSSMREHLPRGSQEEYIDALIKELGLNPMVRPQPGEEGSRYLMRLPQIFKHGGQVNKNKKGKF